VGATSAPTDRLPARADVVVVGAGLAGLAAAHHLTRAGRDVHVLEAADVAGGRARTDALNGFLLDRGFQVVSTAYPELSRVVDVPALQLRPFTRGAFLFVGGRRHRIVDPREDVRGAAAYLRAPIGGVGDKLGLLRWAATAAFAPPARLRAGVDRTTGDDLRRAGAGRCTERAASPFFAGVLLERELTTSSRYARLLMRTFVRGRSAVPAGGMQALPAQLARRLDGRVHLSTPVRAVSPRHGSGAAGVELGDGRRVTAEAVVVATDMGAAAALLPTGGIGPRGWRGVTTVYHAAEAPPDREPMLLVDGDGGLVANSVVLTNAAPEYSADGRALIATSLVGGGSAAPLDVVTSRLSELWSADATRWEHVATYAIPHALPALDAPAPLRRRVRVGPAGSRLFVCGDHRDTPSIQGALVSGRRAAEAVIEG
jgi:phytoene dehydrogenase-like protein